MKMAMELVDNIGELAGVNPITNLITLIINAASTARAHNRVCRKFAQWLETIEGLLKPLLKIPKLMEHPETSKPLKQLKESLQHAYQLVIKYKDRSYPYRFIMGPDIVERFREAQNEIKECIDLVPLIMLFVSQTIHRVDTHFQDKEEEGQKKENNKKQMDQKKGKNKEKDEGRDKEKDTEEGKNREKKGKEENEKVKEKGRDKRKDTENKNEEDRRVSEKDTEKKEKEKEKEKEKRKGKDKEKDTKKERSKEKGKENGREEEEDRGKGKDEKKKNVPPLVETAVLKVGMHCECSGCSDNIKRSILKYPGVKDVVMEMDNRILSVTVVGHFDAKMLRDYVAKNTKKEVDLVGNGGREIDDHQVLEKTGKDSKSIGGGGKPKRGNKNKKRVVPMIAATVVLKVGGTGLRCGCNGCVDKICNRLSKIRGVQQVGIDMDKNQVIVTGTTMDMETLLETLGKNVRRPVEVVRPEMTDGKD